MKSLLLLSASLTLLTSCQSLSLSQKTSFGGRHVLHNDPFHQCSLLTMRKQKASDKRTRRSQRGEVLESDLSSKSNLRSSPIGKAWQYKSVDMRSPSNTVGYGRGRSRKRSQVYNNLSSYHSHFLDLITQEFLAEVGCKCHDCFWNNVRSFVFKNIPFFPLDYRNRWFGIE